MRPGAAPTAAHGAPAASSEDPPPSPTTWAAAEATGRARQSLRKLRLPGRARGYFRGQQLAPSPARGWYIFPADGQHVVRRRGRPRPEAKGVHRLFVGSHALLSLLPRFLPTRLPLLVIVVALKNAITAFLDDGDRVFLLH